MTARVSTCLWFDGQAEDAARFYVSLIPHSGIETVLRPKPDDPALLVEFTLGGTPYQALNGGPQYSHSPAASISVCTKDQAETDRLWDALSAGGSENKCGWLTDRYGVSWQIVPEVLPRLLTSSDRAAADRAMQAMFAMVKIDIPGIEAAYAGN